jgi:hypothetical protein
MISKLQGVTTQKIAALFIITAVRTSDLAMLKP